MVEANVNITYTTDYKILLIKDDWPALLDTTRAPLVWLASGNGILVFIEGPLNSGVDLYVLQEQMLYRGVGEPF